MRKPELQEYGIPKEEYARYQQVHGLYTGNEEKKFPKLLCCLMCVVAGLVTLLVTKDMVRAIAAGLGRVDICFILSICQNTYCLLNNGQRYRSSLGVNRTCTQGRKRNVGGSSMLYCGLLGLGHNGGCCQPNMANGTASTNGSLDGVNVEYGSVCTSIPSMTPTWNTSSLTALLSGPILPLRGRQKNRRTSIASPWSQSRWVQHKDPCRRRRSRQPVEIQADWRSGARCHSG